MMPQPMPKPEPARQPTEKPQDGMDAFLEEARRWQAQLANRYRLLSFAPSSGVGFYEANDVTYRFDLVTEAEDEPLAPEAGPVVRRHEFDQIPSGERFRELAELKSFATEHYLRDKKNAYYALLLSRSIGDELALRTLRLLDHRHFGPVTVSGWLAQDLREDVRPEVAAAALRLARQHGLSRAATALSRELTDLTWPAVFPPALERIRTAPREAAGPLGDLADYVSRLNRPLPSNLAGLLSDLLRLAERQLGYLPPDALRALRSLRDAAQFHSPSLDFLAAMADGQYKDVVGIFTYLLRQGKGAWELAPTFSRLEVRQDDSARALGQECLRVLGPWRARFAGLPLFGPVLELAEGQGELRQWFQERGNVFLRLRERLRERPASSRSPAGTVFAVEASPLYSQALQGLLGRDSHLAEVSLVVAFYADPREVWRRGLLDDFPFDLLPEYLNLAAHGFWFARRVAASAGGPRSAGNNFFEAGLRLTTFANLAAMRLCLGGLGGARDWVGAAATFLTEVGDRSDAAHVAEPIRMLLSNLLAAGWQAGDERLFREAQDVLGRTSSVSEISPVVRLVI